MADIAAKLQRRLECRAYKEDLVQRNVLRDVAPRLQAAQEAIKKERLAQNLCLKVSQRPQRDELEQKNIIKGDLSIAPALQAAQEALRKEKIAQNLAHKLEKRPERDTLMERNVLKEDCVTPDLWEALVELEKERLCKGLERKIIGRPDSSALIKKGVLEPHSFRLLYI